MKTWPSKYSVHTSLFLMCSESKGIPVLECSWSWTACSCNSRLLTSFSKTCFAAFSSTKSCLRATSSAWEKKTSSAGFVKIHIYTVKERTLKCPLRTWRVKFEGLVQNIISWLSSNIRGWLSKGTEGIHVRINLQIMLTTRVCFCSCCFLVMQCTTTEPFETSFSSFL